MRWRRSFQVQESRHDAGDAGSSPPGSWRRCAGLPKGRPSWRIGDPHVDLRARRRQAYAIRKAKARHTQPDACGGGGDPSRFRKMNTRYAYRVLSMSCFGVQSPASLKGSASMIHIVYGRKISTVSPTPWSRPTVCVTASSVDEMGWEDLRSPRRPRGRFSSTTSMPSTCSYMDGDRVLGYQRMLPTTRPAPALGGAAAALRGRAARWARRSGNGRATASIPGTASRGRKLQSGRQTRCSSGIVEWGLASGVSSIIHRDETRCGCCGLVQLHFRTTPLGLPQPIGSDDVGGRQRRASTVRTLAAPPGDCGATTVPCPGGSAIEAPRRLVG